MSSIRNVWEHNSFTAEVLTELGSHNSLRWFSWVDDDTTTDDLFSDWDGSDNWIYTVDNDFAKDLFTRSPWHTPYRQRVSCQCCTACKDILHFNRDLSLCELRASGNDCQLCRLLLHKLEQYVSNEQEKIHLVRMGSALQMQKDGRHILRICSDQGIGSLGDNHDDIQISHPAVPEAASSMHFELLRAWLHQCDESHDCSKRIADAVLPTRLLYIGDRNEKLLILRPSTEVDEERYIALSHCWGKLSPEAKQQICTNTRNLCNRLKGFGIDELPQTFKDAIRVTREIGLRYLWIDSLCIVQDDREDWSREAPRMEDVYASAYCTIAATSATNSYEGFLKRDVISPYIQIEDASGRRLYVCEDIDDFDKDVGKALLNTRGWVLQERVLSRRIIHFSANRTYWECGEGVHCESLMRLKCLRRKRYFLLDPRFPDRLLHTGPRFLVDFIHFLYEGYSKRGFTQKADKVVAISGLDARIARALKCEKRFGIFGRFLHRNLLWRPSGEEKMERIDYGNLKVPSWSWMAYHGGIEFAYIPFHQVDWINNLRFDEALEHALIAEICQFTECRIEQEERQGVLLDSGGTQNGWLRYDVDGDTDVRLQGCVVVGRIKKGNVLIYYILAVRPTCSEEEYERIGVGMVRAKNVSRMGLDVRIV